MSEYQAPSAGKALELSTRELDGLPRIPRPQSREQKNPPLSLGTETSKQRLFDWGGPDKASLCPFLETSQPLTYLPSVASSRGSEENNALAVFPEGGVLAQGSVEVQARKSSQEVLLVTHMACGR